MQVTYVSMSAVSCAPRSALSSPHIAPDPAVFISQPRRLFVCGGPLFALYKWSEFANYILMASGKWRFPYLYEFFFWNPAKHHPLVV